MFKKLMLAAATAATLAAGAIAPTTASADPWRHDGWHGGWHGGHGPGWHSGWGPREGVFAAGILGVAIGASLADPYYGAPPAYYAGPGYWGYYGGCRAYWRWSPRYGRYLKGHDCQ